MDVSGSAEHLGFGQAKCPGFLMERRVVVQPECYKKLTSGAVAAPACSVATDLESFRCCSGPVSLGVGPNISVRAGCKPQGMQRGKCRELLRVALS